MLCAACCRHASARSPAAAAPRLRAVRAPLPGRRGGAGVVIAACMDRSASLAAVAVLCFGEPAVMPVERRFDAVSSAGRVERPCRRPRHHLWPRAHARVQ